MLEEGSYARRVAFRQSVVVDGPVEEVFAWHERPGPLVRLLPPWLPVGVKEEAGSVREGRAVLSLPGGLQWVAVHDPGGFVEGREFTDVLTTPVLGRMVEWRHRHSFGPAGDARTVVTDTVDTRVPGRFLVEMFAYRSRQLAGDLRVHRELNPSGRRLVVAVTGSSGLIGRSLCAFLTTGGHEVVRLVRGSVSAASGPVSSGPVSSGPVSSGGARQWEPSAPAAELLEGVDAVVHLAGESIAGRFTAAHKRAVYESRVEPTRRLAALAARSGVAAFVSASAVGFYGPDRGDEELTESSKRGEGFLADLVADWEEAARTGSGSGCRVVSVRTGIVQSPKGGALRLQRALFETGLGGRLGDGRAWTPWIGIDDMVDVYLRALLDESLEGPLNAVAPGLVRNDEYTRTLARVLHRPAVVPVPRFGPALLLGREGAAEVAEASQRVVPGRLSSAGHRFRWPQLGPALGHVLGRGRLAG
jgi:hypothetical protein